MSECIVTAYGEVWHVVDGEVPKVRYPSRQKKNKKRSGQSRKCNSVDAQRGNQCKVNPSGSKYKINTATTASNSTRTGVVSSTVGTVGTDIDRDIDSTVGTDIDRDIDCTVGTSIDSSSSSAVDTLDNLNTAKVVVGSPSSFGSIDLTGTYEGPIDVVGTLAPSREGFCSVEDIENLPAREEPVSALAPSREPFPPTVDWNEVERTLGEILPACRQALACDAREMELRRAARRPVLDQLHYWSVGPVCFGEVEQRGTRLWTSCWEPVVASADWTPTFKEPKKPTGGKPSKKTLVRFGGCWVTLMLWQGGDGWYSNIVFNPSKLDAASAAKLKAALDEVLALCPHYLTYDVAVDVRFPIDQFVYKGDANERPCYIEVDGKRVKTTTRYLGRRNSAGAVKLYDKARERREKGHAVEGELTRLELTCSASWTASDLRDSWPTYEVGGVELPAPDLPAELGSWLG